jgi:hypothetical protein
VGPFELRYTHPRSGADVEIRKAVRVPRDRPFDLRTGERLPLVCWGVMPSGMLRIRCSAFARERAEVLSASEASWPLARACRHVTGHRSLPFAKP